MWGFIATLYALFMLPPLVYLLAISIAGIIGIRKNATTEQQPTGETESHEKTRICVLIPAHNEQQTIKRTIDSLLQARQNRDDIDLYVIADNCTDDTASIAAKTQANVLERTNKHLKGKGAALQWAMQQVSEKNYDYTLIIDADSIVNDSYFDVLRDCLQKNHNDVVQTRYEALVNTHSSIKRLAMLGFNVLRPNGRVALGGSAGIMGNGFIVSRNTLERVPFHANSIVEDLEYHMRLVEADVKVAFCDGARVYGEMPNDDAASDIQSSRWEGGRLGVLKAAFLPLIAKSITDLLKGKLHALDALLDLMLLPIGYMVILLALGLFLPHTLALAIFGLCVITLYVIGAALCGKGLSELSVLKKLPFFLWQKITRLPALFSASSTKTQWKRTPRK